MNIREFAQYCQVSPSTVSRYFSGEARLSPPVQERIRRAVEETGYAPSPQFQRRKKGGSGVIAAFTPLFHHRFFVDILTALKEQCAVMGYQLLIAAADDPHGVDYLPTLRHISVEGVVLMDEGAGDELPRKLMEARIPLVMCGGLSLSHAFPSVHIDDISAAYDGANYLIGLGHKSIAVISDRPHAVSSGFQRIAGCKKALEDAGLALPEESIVYAGNSFANGYEGMRELLRGGCTATAVFAFNDAMASGAMAAITEAGMQVPGDISVLGFDDCSICQETRPRLTTVSQPLTQLVRRSLEVLLSPGGGNESITLPHSIAIRSSCRER